MINSNGELTLEYLRLFHWLLDLTEPVKRVQVLMSPACHRVLKQLCAYDDVSMSDFMYGCAKQVIHTRAKTDDHILTLLQREGIAVQDFPCPFDH